MRKTKHFVNLTNGIEHIEELLEMGCDVNFVRIQSTTLERKDWSKLMHDLDHNLLMYLALGYDCYFYDCGTNRTLSKTCSVGVHLVNYILQRRWTGQIPPAVRFSKNGRHKYNEDKFYDYVYNHLFTYNQDGEKAKLKKKIDYYRKYAVGDIGDIIPASRSTSNDGNYVFYSNLVRKLL
jgi:hypothetical protein